MTRLKASNNINQEVRRSMDVFCIIKEHLNISWSMAMKSYPHLATPIQIGKVTVKNRIFMAPMDTGFGNDVYGNFTPEGVE